MSSVPHFAVFFGTNGLVTRAWLLLISCHDNKLFAFTELLLSLFQTLCMFILPWIHAKITVKFTMSNVDGCVIYKYKYMGCLNCSENEFCTNPT